MFSAAAFALGFFALAAAALARHPIHGLYLYLMVIYVHPPSRWWGPILPDLRWSLFSAVIAVVAMAVHWKRIEKPVRGWIASAPGRALLLLVVWLWVQNLWALDASSHANATIQYSKYLVVFFLCYYLANNAKHAADILLVHVMGCFFLGLLCFLSGRDHGNRLDGVGGPGIDDANTLGMYLATGAVVGAVLFLSSTGWRRIAILAAMPFILNGLVLTGSRGAFLGLVAGGCMLFWLRPLQRRWVFWIAAAVGIVASVSLMDRSFIDRMFTIRAAVEQGREGMDSSAESRLEIIAAQSRMAARFPHGAGHRGTAALSAEYLDMRWLTYARGEEDKGARSSHNTFMTLLVEQGLIGGAIYLWLTIWGAAVAVVLRSCVKRGLPAETLAPAVASASAIAVVWTAGQFTDYLITEVQLWLFAILAAAMHQLRKSTTTATRPAGREQARQEGAYT